MLSLSRFKCVNNRSLNNRTPCSSGMSLSGTVGNLGMMVDTTAGVIGQGYTQQSQPTQKNTNSTPPRFFFSRRSKAQAKKSTFSPFGDSDGGQHDTGSMSTFVASLLPTSRVESMDSPPESTMGMGFGSSSSEGIPLETVDEDKASNYRRWFPMFINSQAAPLDWPPGFFFGRCTVLSYLSFSLKLLGPHGGLGSLVKCFVSFAPL